MDATRMVLLSTGNRTAWFDSVRGIALAIVMLSHLKFNEACVSAIPLCSLLPNGDVGVYLFYVLSGFLVTGVLSRDVVVGDCISSRVAALKGFYGRRVLRLAPTMVLFLCAYSAIPLQHDALSWWQLVLPVSQFYAGPYITWHIKTLHNEELYYLALGLCVLVSPARLETTLWCWAVVWPSARCVLFLLGALWLPLRAGLDLLPPFESFAAGGLACLHKRRIWEIVTRYDRRLRSLVVFSALALMVGLSLMRHIAPFSYILVWMWPALYSASAVVVVVAVADGAQHSFVSKVVSSVGLVSYSLYLFQQFLLCPWLSTYGWTCTPRMFMSAAALYIAVSVSWARSAELPLTRVGRKMFPPRE